MKLNFFYNLAFTIFLVVTNSLEGYSQQTITLQQAITISLSNNPSIKQALLNETGNNLDWEQSKADLYPSLNVNTASNMNFARTTDPSTNLMSAQNSFTFSGEVVTNIAIFQGFRKLEQIKYNKSLLESSRSNVEKLKNNLRLQVISTYLSILNYQDQLMAVNDQMALANHSFDDVIKQFKAGKKMQADTSRAQSQVLKTEVDKVTIVNQLNSAILDFKQLLNLPPDTTVVFSKPADENIKIEQQLVDRIYNTAVVDFPDIKQEEFVLASKKQALVIAKSGFYPTLSFSGVVASSYLHQLQNYVSFFNLPEAPFFKQLHTNLYEYASLNLSIPIFNNLHNKIAASKAKIDLENEAINLNMAKNNLYKIINQAKNDLDAAEKNFYLAKQSYGAAKETFNATEKRYKGGLSSSLDYNQAQSDMNAAQFTMIKDKYDLVFKSKVIAYYLGNDINY